MSPSAVLASSLRKIWSTVAGYFARFFVGEASPREARKLIENRTAWRIVIRYRGGQASPRDGQTHVGDLVLSPFGTRVMPAAALKQFDYESWENRNFVRTDDDRPVRPPPPFGAVVRLATWMVLIATVFILPALWVNLSYWFAVVANVLAVFLVERKPIFRWVSEAVNLVIIFVIALGLAFGFYSLFTREPTVTDVSIRAGIGVLFFVVIASSLPALLYYIFERQKSDTLREFFLRDIIRLNPHVHTLDEAQFRFGKLADEVYGRQSSQDFLGGLQVSLLINLALTTLGWSLALMPNISLVPANATPAQAIALLIVPQPHPIIYGALGAYFFTLSLLFRRYVRADLGAKAYTHVAVRQLLTVILVWVISVPTALWANLSDTGRAALLVFSFLVGIVPETALALLQDFLRNQKLLTDRIPSLREDLPLNNLEGVTLYDQARLLEEGIENIENLAHHNLLDLMLRTRLPTSRLTDLVDQAILYLHFHEPQAAGDPKAGDLALTTLRRYGIRTATDLERARDQAQARGPDEAQAFLSLLDGPADRPRRLRVALDTLEDDEWMIYLREWNRNQDMHGALSLEEVEQLLSHREDQSGDETLPARLPPASPVGPAGNASGDLVTSGRAEASTVPPAVAPTHPLEASSAAAEVSRHAPTPDPAPTAP